MATNVGLEIVNWQKRDNMIGLEHHIMKEKTLKPQNGKKMELENMHATLMDQKLT